MRLFACLPLFFFACATDDVPPLGPGGGGGGAGAGGGGGGGELIDAMAGLPDAELLQISGRLCVVDDLRRPGECLLGNDLGGINVEVASSGEAVTSGTDGSFTLPSPGGARAVLKVSFGNNLYRDLVVPVPLIEGGFVGLRLPLLPLSTWQSLLTTVGVAEPDNSASIAAYVVDEQTPASGVEMLAPVGSTGLPLYDQAGGPNDWLTGAATGNNGAVLFLGVPAADPNVSFVVIPPGAPSFNATSVPVIADALTFVTLALP